ncbi:cupin-like domain-containing protein [Actinomadura formosensis]|uniref:cupin-like domain-containing protein n=1 Tax=Actinomadura formosensis TaxID=60706 RepID=UPI003D8D7E5A
MPSTPYPKGSSMAYDSAKQTSVLDGDELIGRLTAAGLDIRPIPAGPSHTDVRHLGGTSAVPRVFRGAVNGWPARRRWRPGLLREAHGDQEVTALMDLPSTGVLLPQDQAAYERCLSFGEFLDAMQASPADSPCYLAYKRPEGLFPEDDYDFSIFGTGADADTDTRVWVGSAGTRSALHSDLKDNLFCQIWGEKLVILLGWQDSAAAYPFPDNLVNSRIDFMDLDLDGYPLLRSAVLYAQIVRPGDVILIPRGCWHDFTALTPSISINHWYGPSVRARDYIRLLLSLGPRYWTPVARDFVVHGVLRRPEKTAFFFSPPSTGKRLYDLVRWGNFSRGNDPTG